MAFAPLSKRNVLPALGVLAVLGLAVAFVARKREQARRFADRMPVEEAFDSTAPLMKDPYRFISRECERFGSDCFEGRFLMRKTIFVRGPYAAELFYDESRITRQGALPEMMKNTLIGRRTVLGMDGEAHRHRKAMLLSLLTPERIAAFTEVSGRQWRQRMRVWETKDRVTLFPELVQIIGRSVLEWAEIPVSGAELPIRIAELGALFNYAGAKGPMQLFSRFSRRQINRWAGRLIQDVRSGRLNPSADSPLATVAWYRDLNGNLLDTEVAAVELVNILRPPIAVSVFITQIAHALHEHPECRAKLLGDENYATLFVNEVRRLYPFFPATIGKVRQDFEWGGYFFRQGHTVMLDIWGTNQDARTWEDPQAFRPERFLEWDGSPYNYIPQGGGDMQAGHRCPGEDLTIALMRQATDMLVNHVEYYVPEEQDLEIDFARLPALPASRFIISNVRLLQGQNRGMKPVAGGSVSG